VEQLLHAVEQNAELARLSKELPQVLGSGNLLQSVFLRLFPYCARPMAVSRSPTTEPRLTRREQDILLEMAKGRSKEEIAGHFFISPQTVVAPPSDGKNRLLA
jgi:DNA-binding CsgD family transcriptional regulator